MDENDSRNANKPAAPLVPPPSMGSPEQIAEAKEFAKKRAAEQKPAPPPEKKSGTATVYYSAAGDVAGVSFDGKHYKNDSDRDDRIDLQQTAGLATATLSKKTFQIENIDPKKLRHELESRAQETVNNAIKEQLAPQQPSVTTPQSNTAPTPPPVSPAKRNRGLPGKLSAKPTYDPNALQKPQQPAAPQTVVQQKVAVQPKPEEPEPAESKQSSGSRRTQHPRQRLL